MNSTGLKNRTLLRMSLASLAYLGHVWLYKGFYVDDAFISFRYVRQWVDGNGLVYNVGERVEGYSNFLWIVLLTPFEIAGIDLPVAAKLLGVLLGLITLLLTAVFAKKFFGNTPQFAPYLLAASGPLAAWSMGGLETLLFSMLLTLSLYLFLMEEEKEQGWYSGVTFAALALTRPEGVLFALLAIGYRSWKLRKIGSYPSRRDLYRFGAFAAIFGSYFLWRFLYYGALLPNTVLAKSMGLHPRGVIEGAYYLFNSFVNLGGIFFLAFPLLLALLSRAQEPTVIPFLTVNVATYGLFVLFAGGDWMPMQRFLVHVLPLIFLLVQAGFGKVNEIWSTRWRFQPLVILMIVQTGYLLAISAEQRFVQGVGSGTLRPRLGTSAAFLRRNVEPEDTIAVIDAGRSAYYLPLSVRLVDMVGLTDEHIARLPPTFPGGLFGRGDAFGKWDVDYVLAQNPRFVQVILRPSEPGELLETNFSGTTILVNDDRFQERYQLIGNGIFGIKE